MIETKIYIPNIPISAMYGIKKIGKEEYICCSCPLPKSKCNGDCKRYHDELKKLKSEKNE